MQNIEVVEEMCVHSSLKRGNKRNSPLKKGAREDLILRTFIADWYKTFTVKKLLVLVI